MLDGLWLCFKKATRIAHPQAGGMTSGIKAALAVIHKAADDAIAAAATPSAASNVRCARSR